MKPKFTYLGCDCVYHLHFLRISDDDAPENLAVEYVSTRGGSMWRRLKEAVKFVLGRDDLVYADLYISRDEWIMAARKEGENDEAGHC